jgi:Subtilase family
MITVILLGLGGGSAAAATDPLPRQDGSLIPSPGLTAVLPAEFTGNATTTAGGGTFDLNAALGAGSYYTHSSPINGQGTVTTNLEAGHIWNGHNTLTHVQTFIHDASTFGGTATATKFDRHATAAGALIGARATAGQPLGGGIAPGTTLQSAAIATQWAGSAYALSFGLSNDSVITAFTGAFSTSDVINSSYGFTDPGGTADLTVFTDSLSFMTPRTTYVTSAGNSTGSNTVGSPGAGYNTITVGALGEPNAFNSVAAFSSRGPQTFSYYNASGQIVSVAGVRAPVDISAPGVSVVSAYYGGQTGGNNTTLAGSTDLGSNPDAYAGVSGTSFSSPIVAGGASLVVSAAKNLPGLSSNPDASRSVVVKSLLLTGADKTTGWSNGLSAAGSPYLKTTQSLDWAAGAGAMNLANTFRLQALGQTDVLGTAQGVTAMVNALGWDYGNARLGVSNDYIIDHPLEGGSTFTTTLSWMRAREWNGLTGDLFEIAQANLNLSVWSLNPDDSFAFIVASSESSYNVVEHLSFSVPSTGRYGIRVGYGGNTFDNTTGGAWGSTYLQDYGLAWSATAIPETCAMLPIALLLGTPLVLRRRQEPRRRPTT